MEFFEEKYPSHIEIPENYWVCSTFFNIDVEYCEKDVNS